MPGAEWSPPTTIVAKYYQSVADVPPGWLYPGLPPHPWLDLTYPGDAVVTQQLAAALDWKPIAVTTQYRILTAFMESWRSGFDMPLGGRIPSPKSEALKPVLWFVAITVGPLAAASYSGNDRVLTWMLYFALAGVVSDERKGQQAIVAKEEPVPNPTVQPAAQSARPQEPQQ